MLVVEQSNTQNERNAQSCHEWTPHKGRAGAIHRADVLTYVDSQHLSDLFNWVDVRTAASFSRRRVPVRISARHRTRRGPHIAQSMRSAGWHEYSYTGERGRRGFPGYCTSKAALTTYLESLRNRCSRYGVNVVTIKPGFVDTAMTRGKKGLFWLVSADKVAKRTLALAKRRSSASAFVPYRWALVAAIVRALPSFLFKRLNF